MVGTLSIYLCIYIPCDAHLQKVDAFLKIWVIEQIWVRDAVIKNKKKVEFSKFGGPPPEFGKSPFFLMTASLVDTKNNKICPYLAEIAHIVSRV